MICILDEPPPKKTKNDLEISHQTSNPIQWDVEPEDHKLQIIELLQANLQQLDEVKQSIETQGYLRFSPAQSQDLISIKILGQAVVSMLSQLINVISCGQKFMSTSSGPSRIDEAITATIREIGIPQENI